MSRVEQILKGTFTGKPLSRVEELLINATLGGGGSVDLSGINRRIDNLEEISDNHTNTLSAVSEKLTNQEEFNTSTNEDLSNLESAVTAQNETISTLQNAVTNQGELNESIGQELEVLRTGMSGTSDTIAAVGTELGVIREAIGNHTAVIQNLATHAILDSNETEESQNDL